MATYSDQFFQIDPANPPGVGTFLAFSVRSITDQNNDNDFDRFNNDNINGVDITASYPGDTVTINVPGVGNVTYTGITFYLANGTEVFTPTDGQVLQNGTFVSSTWVSGQGPLLVSQLGPPCFAAGTLIDTPQGPRPVEEIAAGDQVETLDHGPQPVRWHGQRTVAGTGRYAPIRFAPDAPGNDRPLLVSPQHRMLVTGWHAELLFGEKEVLVPALHLVDGKTVTRAPMRCVTYHHLMFDGHEILSAEGRPSESFFPGDTILMEDDALRQEVLELFPELAGRQADWSLARPALRAHEAVALAAA